MHAHTLTKSACQALVKENQKATKEENLFTMCVIDCAEIEEEGKQKFVVYELQPPIGSAIGKKSLLNLLRGFDQIIFIYNMDINTDSIRGERNQDIFLAHAFNDVPHFEVVTWETFINGNFKFENNKLKKLILFDTHHSNHATSYKENITQILCFKYLLNQQNWFCLSSDAIFGPFETFFYSKHFERLGLSNCEFTPSFILIEKKEFYRKEEILNFIAELNIKKDILTQVVIKGDLGTLGKKNTFLYYLELGEYLNSKEFQDKYKHDDIILIEEVLNQKKQDNFFHTQRYAASLQGSRETYLKIYEDLHVLPDSHRFIKCLWFDENQNELKDESIKQQLRDALLTIQNLDYLKLIEQLLLSDNHVKILFALQVIEYNYPILFVEYDILLDKNKLSAKSAKINLSDNMLIVLSSLLRSENISIRNRVGVISKLFLEFINQKRWINLTEKNVMQRLEKNLVELKEIEALGFAKKEKDAKQNPLLSKMNLWTSRNDWMKILPNSHFSNVCLRKDYAQ